MFDLKNTLPESEKIQNQESKIDYLEGLRGVAAFSVVIHHYLIAFYPAHFTADLGQSHLSNHMDVAYATSPFNILTNGNFAVCLFFVLSGYVLSYKYYKTNTLSTLISMAGRRYIRLMIPALFTILVGYVFIYTSLFYNKETVEFTKSDWWMGYFWDFHPAFGDMLNTGLIKVIFSGNDVYSTSMWTLNWEFYGSLFLFSFLALTHHIRNRRIIYIAVLSIIFLTPNTWAYYGGFILGASLNLILPKYEAISNRTYKTILKTAALFFGLLIGSVPSSGLKEDSFYQLLYFDRQAPLTQIFHVFGAFLLLFFVLISKNTQSFFAHKLSMFLGKISFSMYLIHPLVIGSLSCFVFLKLKDHYSYNTAASLSILAGLPVVIIVSYLMSIYVDKPGINLASYVYNRLFKSEKS